jgi:hypothetical protein
MIGYDQINSAWLDSINGLKVEYICLNVSQHTIHLLFFFLFPGKTDYQTADQ